MHFPTSNTTVPLAAHAGSLEVKGGRMHSCLYVGSLRHRRFAPRPHAFAYRLYMLYLDLAELEEVFHGRWLWSTSHPTLCWWRRRDYLGDADVSLDSAVRDAVERATGAAPRGPIRMLTQLRTFGLVFNPVTFYYCFDEGGTQVRTILAEITNTPWNERHSYVLHDPSEAASPAQLHRYQLAKRFHVSPFMPMDIRYDWRFSSPSDRLGVHMRNLSGEDKIFDATLDMQRREIDGPGLARTLASLPLMTTQVVTGIYWQALRLWLKHIPFHAHPDKVARSPSQRRPGEISR